MQCVVVTSVFLCITSFVTAASVLILASLHLTDPDNGFPIPAVEQWHQYLSHIIPVSAVIMLISLFSCWGVSRPRTLWFSTLLIFVLGCALVAGTIYIDLLSKELVKTDQSPQSLKNRTTREFVEHQKLSPTDTNWVPAWLAKIQNQSSMCCGILGYEDYKEFWPLHPKAVPLSCCRSFNNCNPNFAQLEWPQKPTDFIKNDEGCSALIIRNGKERIQETLTILVCLTSSVALTFIWILIQCVRSGLSGSQQSSVDNDCLVYFRSCGICLRRNRFKNYDSNGNPLIDPNNPLLNPSINPSVYLNDQSSYSFTFFQQLSQTQTPASNFPTQFGQPQQTRIPFDSPTIIATNIPFDSPTIMVSTNGQRIQPGPQIIQNQPPPQQQPPSITYEVIQKTLDPIYLQQNQMKTAIIDSVENIPIPGASGYQNMLDMGDEQEKQNLRQLLRLGRRHRRHRKQGTDLDQQQQQMQ